MAKTSELAFRDRIYRVVAKIPRGKVASYGLVALLAGRLGAARAVGTAMREVPRGLKLPCHRVIKSDGSLCPKHMFRGRQKAMLRAEKVQFKKNGRVDMAASEWDGE
jgi:methylated-DNA-protein-cysteine methyltransferase related protein